MSKKKKKTPKTVSRPVHRAVEVEDTTQVTEPLTVPGEVVSVEDSAPKSTHVLIATPCYGGQVTEPYLQSVVALMLQAKEQGIPVSLFTLAGESLITRARNEAVRVFMSDEKYTHLMFIDADIEFTFENFKRLLDSGYEVSASVYPLKTINWDRLLNQEFENRTAMIANTIEAVVNAVEPIGEDGFAPCLDAGTGFMLIQRSAIERLIEAHPETKYYKDDLGTEGRVEAWALFDTMISEGRYLSEDYTFCRRWQGLGEHVHVDLQSPILIHQGLYKYGKV